MNKYVGLHRMTVVRAHHIFISILFTLLLFKSGSPPLLSFYTSSVETQHSSSSGRAAKSGGILLAFADKSGKKLRSYLQKKMFQGKGGDPNRPVAKLGAEDAVDILTDTSRKFDTLIFFSQSKDMKVPQEAMGFYDEFEFFARQVVTNLKTTNKDQLDQLIFAEMVYSNRTGPIIQGVGVQSLPSAFFMKRDITIDIKANKILPQREKDRFEVPFSFQAEDYAKVLKNSHDIDVGPIVRPSIFDEWYTWPSICVFLLVAAAVGWRVYHSEFIKNPYLWSSLTFSVFSVATSGLFHTVIKKEPWAINGMALLPTRQAQTRFESVMIAGLYLLITTSILFLIMVAPRMNSTYLRYIISYFMIAMAYVCGNYYFTMLDKKQSFMIPRIVIENGF